VFPLKRNRQRLRSLNVDRKLLLNARFFARLSVCAFALAATMTAQADAFPTGFGDGFVTRSVPVDGSTVSMTIGGTGPVILLLHGYAEDSRMWRPFAAAMAPRFTVIAADLPGIGNSSIPATEIDMTTSAKRIHDAVRSLGYRRVRVVGHDIGLMVAYAYAAMYSRDVDRLVLMDAFLPGVSGWEPIYNDPAEWHFRFFGPTPVALVRGRERIYFEHFWNDFAANKKRSISEESREEYASAYARPGRMAAGFAYFASWPKTAVQFARFAKVKLAMPVLCIGGDKSLGTALAAQTKLVSLNSTSIVLKNTGHWLMEERPSESIAALSSFLSRDGSAP
jgi:pimeloyl-ACP methyl ester carboxylesterase